MVHAKINYIYICHVPHVWIANRRSCSSHIRSSVDVNSSKFFQKYGCDHIWLEHCTWLLNSNISVYHNVLESAMYRKESMLLWTTLFSASKWTECVRPILLCKLSDTKNNYSTIYVCCPFRLDSLLEGLAKIARARGVSWHLLSRCQRNNVDEQIPQNNRSHKLFYVTLKLEMGVDCVGIH